MAAIPFIIWLGGMSNYLQLREDARLFDLFVIAYEGEAEAMKIRRMQARH